MKSKSVIKVVMIIIIIIIIIIITIIILVINRCAIETYITLFDARTEVEKKIFEIYFYALELTINETTTTTTMIVMMMMMMVMMANTILPGPGQFVKHLNVQLP